MSKNTKTTKTTPKKQQTPKKPVQQRARLAEMTKKEIMSYFHNATPKEKLLLWLLATCMDAESCATGNRIDIFNSLFCSADGLEMPRITSEEDGADTDLIELTRLIEGINFVAESC